MEIFLTRTQIDPFYESTFIQVIDGATLTDVTFNYFDNGVNEARSYVDNPQRGWIYWMTIYNKDGEIYFTSNDFSNNIKWKYSKGPFTTQMEIHESSFEKFTKMQKHNFKFFILRKLQADSNRADGN